MKSYRIPLLIKTTKFDMSHKYTKKQRRINYIPNRSYLSKHEQANLSSLYVFLLYVCLMLPATAGILIVNIIHLSFSVNIYDL